MWYATDFNADKSNFLVGNSSDSWSNGALAVALNLSYPKFSATVRAVCPHLPLGYLGECRTKFAAKIEFSFFIFSLLWIIKQPFIKLTTRLDVGNNFPLVQVVTHYVFSKIKKNNSLALSRGTLGQGEPCPSWQQILCREPAFTVPRNIWITNRHSPFFSVGVPC